MLQQLTDAIEALEVPVDAASLQQLLRVLDRLDARVCDVLDDFDRARLWDAEHAPSLTAWLKLPGRRSPHDAVGLNRRVQRLRHLPLLRAAWHDGRLSSGHVDMVLRNLTDDTTGLFAACEAEQVAMLEQFSVE